MRLCKRKRRSPRSDDNRIPRLQYEVLVEGTGLPKPAATDTVVTHYHGTLTDGTVFDSSVER